MRLRRTLRVRLDSVVSMIRRSPIFGLKLEPIVPFPPCPRPPEMASRKVSAIYSIYAGWNGSQDLRLTGTWPSAGMLRTFNSPNAVSTWTETSALMCIMTFLSPNMRS